MKRLHYWFAGLVFSLGALAEMVRLWLIYGDNDTWPPSGGAPA